VIDESILRIQDAETIPLQSEPQDQFLQLTRGRESE
jgi:hypothetical protein